MQWQPMASAPRDGTIVLGCTGSGGTYRVFDMYYDTLNNVWEAPDFDGRYDPVAWMPRPAQP